MLPTFGCKKVAGKLQGREERRGNAATPRAGGERAAFNEDGLTMKTRKQFDSIFGLPFKNNTQCAARQRLHPKVDTSCTDAFRFKFNSLARHELTALSSTKSQRPPLPMSPWYGSLSRS
jgi:hypothetical protein